MSITCLVWNLVSHSSHGPPRPLQNPPTAICNWSNVNSCSSVMTTETGDSFAEMTSFGLEKKGMISNVWFRIGTSTGKCCAADIKNDFKF